MSEVKKENKFWVGHISYAGGLPQRGNYNYSPVAFAYGISPYPNP